MQIELRMTEQSSLFALRKVSTWIMSECEGAAESTNIHLTDEEMSKVFVKHLRERFLRFTVHLEDNVIVCPGRRTGGLDERILFISFDCLTGDKAEAWLRIEQIVSIMALAIGGDEIEHAEQHYATVDRVVDCWPTSVRPIP